VPSLAVLILTRTLSDGQPKGTTKRIGQQIGHFLFQISTSSLRRTMPNVRHPRDPLKKSNCGSQKKADIQAFQGQELLPAQIVSPESQRHLSRNPRHRSADRLQRRALTIWSSIREHLRALRTPYANVPGFEYLSIPGGENRVASF
jgi:hypothetical protein